MTKKELDTASYNHVDCLKREIEMLQAYINPNIGGQGHIHTTIAVLEWHIKEISGENK